MKRLAMTKDGKMTWCTADDEHIGKGRCNHIAHQKILTDPKTGEQSLEDPNDFMTRIQEEKDQKEQEILNLSYKGKMSYAQIVSI